MNTYKTLIDDLVIPSFSRTVSEMSKDTIKEKFGIEAASMYGFDQKNPYHCYDLLMHSARTVDGIGKRGLSDDEFAMLRVAAFYHDIGKPDVAFWNEKKQRQSYYGHALRSAELAKKIFERINMPESMVEQICFMIAHHDDFTNYRTKDQIKTSVNNTSFIEVTPEHIDKLIKRNAEKGTYCASNKDYFLLLQLCNADICAQTDVVWENGKIISTREDRLEVMRSIQQLIKKREDIKNVFKITA